jgi:hypothetical protein
MISLWFLCNWCWCRCWSCFGLGCPPLTSSFSFFSLALPVSLVSLNLCLDALLGFQIGELLLALPGSFFDLLFALQFLLDILSLTSSLLPDFLSMSVSDLSESEALQQLTSFLFCSSLSLIEPAAFFALRRSRSSSSLAFFSSSVRGAISSVDSEKSV